MGTRAPRVGDNIEILRERPDGWPELRPGDILSIVGLWSEGIVISLDGIAYRLFRRSEGQSWKNLTVHDSQVQAWAPTAKIGVQNMKKQAFNVLILQHMPVPGIPETTADIETTKVFGPELVLAVNGESAKALAMRKLPETVNVEYIEVLIRPF